MEETKDNRREVKYNLGQAQLQLIGNLMAAASSRYVHGDTLGYWFSLHSLRQQIVSRLDQAERLELKALEDKICYCLCQKKKAEEEEGEEEQPRDRQRALFYLLKYDTRLKELLEAKGFLVPLKESVGSVFQKRYEDG